MRIIAKAGRDDIAIIYIADMDQTGERDSEKLVEFVESLQPPIPRKEKWVLIISTLYGCPVGCSFCDAGIYYKGKLSKEDMISQIDFLVLNRFGERKVPVEKFKIQFARMGEPAFNENVLDVLSELPGLYDAPGLLPSLSTIAPLGTDGFFERLLEIKKDIYHDRFQLQFSIHSTDEKQRDALIPVRKWSFKRIGDYGKRFYTENGRKITLNFALAEGMSVDPDVLRVHFPPDTFIVKLTPINPTFSAKKKKIVSHILADQQEYEIIERLKESGYEVILSIGEIVENNIGSNCGQHVMNYLKERENGSEVLTDSYTYPLAGLNTEVEGRQ
jgi:23S rRNA (adenine2503-C2)-methyltransferase